MNCCKDINYNIFPFCLSAKNTKVTTFLEDIENTIGFGIGKKDKFRIIKIESETSLFGDKRMLFYNWLNNTPKVFILKVILYGILTEVKVSLLDKEIVESYLNSFVTKIPLTFIVEEEFSLDNTVCKKTNCKG